MNERVKLSQAEQEIIDDIVTRFVSDHKPSHRHSLILKFEDPDALNDLTNRGFLKSDPTNQNFLPTLLAFCCCENESVLSQARESTVSVIKAMRSLFSKVEPNEMVTASDIEAEIKKLGASLTVNTLWLGLYLAESFSVFGGWQPAPDQIGKASVNIGERVVKMKNPEQIWDERVSQELQWLAKRDSYAVAARTIQPMSPLPEDSDAEISSTQAMPQHLEAAGGNPLKHGLQIFISHSSRDAELAKQLIDLLRVALPVDPIAIRCTSVDGYRLEGGADANDQIRTEIWGARVFIGLLTPTSLASTYVLFELGARWGAKLQLKPLLAAGMRPSELRAPLSSLNALSCDHEEQILQLIREIGKILGIQPHHADSYLSNVRALATRSKEAAAPRARVPGALRG
ncbi:MAG: toll/interleukin-1 receptor domain-containing protein [Terriglobales bacterium]